MIDGYTRQLAAYKRAEETVAGHYLVIDVGNMGRKDDKLVALKNAAAARADPVSALHFVDGRRRPSASKL